MDWDGTGRKIIGIRIRIQIKTILIIRIENAARIESNNINQCSG